MIFYAGVGSRECPEDVCAQITALAAELAERGLRLRSGHAEGADYAFELGAAGEADIFLPWPNFGKERLVLGKTIPRPEEWTRELAQATHPRWQTLNNAARKLHMRNVHQVLGRLGEPLSTFVVCWTPGGKGQGGTGQAIRIAHSRNVPIYDLGRETIKEVMEAITALPEHA